jgi:hypothetical protein
MAQGYREDSINYHPPDTPEGHSRTQCPTRAERDSILLLFAGHARGRVVVLRCYNACSPMC